MPKSKNTTTDLIRMDETHSLKEKITQFKVAVEDPLKRYESIMIILQSILIDLVERYDDGFDSSKKDGSNPFIKHIVDLSKEIRSVLGDARKEVIQSKFIVAIRDSLQLVINIVEEDLDPKQAKEIVQKIQNIRVKVTDTFKVEKL